MFYNISRPQENPQSGKNLKIQEIYKDENLFDSTKMRPLNCPLWQELQAITNVFKNYMELQKYAEYKGQRIYNASEYSWIDAFERKQLD